MGQIILVRGGGDLASGVILRLFRTGLSVVVTELEKPLAVRRTVAFSQAVYDDLAHIEEVEAKRAFDSNEANALVTVNDYTPGTDILQFDQSDFADVTAVLAAAQNDGSGDVVITHDATNTVTLVGIDLTTLQNHSSDIHLV